MAPPSSRASAWAYGGSVPEACRAAVKETSVTTASADGAEKYAPSRRVYAELYGDLRRGLRSWEGLISKARTWVACLRL